MQKLWSKLKLNSSRLTLLFSSLAMVFVLPLTATQVQAGTLYLVDDTRLYAVDTSTAAKTYVGAGPCNGLALSPNPSVFLYCSLSMDTYGVLYAVARDGSRVKFLTIINGDADRGLAYNTSNGLLYGTDNQSFGVVDPATGDITPLDSPLSEPECLAADPNNNLIYGVDRDENLIVYNISTDSWSTVVLTGLESGNQAGLAFDPVSNVLYFIEKDGDLYTINPGSDTATQIGTVSDVDRAVGLTFAPSDPVSILNGDFELDGDVDGSDLSVFSNNFGQTP